MSAAPEMKSAAAKLYRHLYGGGRGYQALFSGRRAENERLEDTESRYFEYPAGTSGALKYALQQTEAGREVYHCPHLLTARRRIKENAGEVFALWGDLDGAEVPNGSLKPTAVIESSPGRFHIYYRLTDSVPPEIAESLNRRLAARIGADPSGFDLTQLLRVPDTTNHKHEGLPVVRVRELDAGRSYSPAELDEVLPEIEGPKSTGARASSDEPPVQLDSRGLQVWRGEDPKLADSGKIDRSGSLLKIGRVLFDAGANRDVIERALEERDQVLGWNKYTGRADADARYSEIVDELEKNGRNRRTRVTVGGKSAGFSEQPRGPFNLTDLGNSERFIDDHGDTVRYCWPWSRWLVYDGRRWSTDDAGAIHKLAKETVRGIYQEAAAAGDEDRRKALAKHASRSEAENRIQAMISLARSEVPVMPAELDADPWVLNVMNGTIELKTGELREHRREDMITKIAPVEYDQRGAAPVWSAALERVLPSPAVRKFFQKLCGYAISGEVSEHVLPVLFGTGANGKSTILTALLEAVGEYGMQAAPDLLIAKRGSHPTEIADLFGMRFVASIEVEDGQRLAEALVKSLTGGDKVRARRMRQDFWQFDPTHTPFLCTNYKPEIRGTGTAIWRRIRLIPFTETIPPAEQDKKLLQKLRAESSGVLAWAVEGCLEWQREGLDAPEEVRKATGAYRSEMDVIGAFLRDECEIGRGYKATLKSVYERYEEWCEEGGERAETKRKFNARLTERGQFDDRRSGPGGLREWHGLKLLTKTNVSFAGKLTKRPENDYNRLSSSSRSANSTNSVSSSVTSVEEPAEEQEREIRQLVKQGFSDHAARAEVLAKDHPIGCGCEVCQ